MGLITLIVVVVIVSSVEDVRIFQPPDEIHLSGGNSGNLVGVEEINQFRGVSVAAVNEGSMKFSDIHDLVLKRGDLSLPFDHINGSSAHENRQSSEPDRPPLGRRFALSIGLLLSGLCLVFRDRKNANDGWRLFGASEIWGLLLSGCGLAVWWITFAFPSSWSWWL